MNQISKLKKRISELEKDLSHQCKQTKAFGDELQYFIKKKANVRYELKLKKYRDEIVKLKKKIEEYEDNEDDYR